MSEKVTPERVATLAAAARVPLRSDAAARIANAVTPAVARFSAEKIALKLEDRARDLCRDRARWSEAVSDPALLSLTEVAEQIRSRKLSSVEVTQALLARIAQWQPKLNAFVRIEADEALQAARDSRRAARKDADRRGRCTACRWRTRTCITSPASRPAAARRCATGWIADQTSTVIRRLHDEAGAIRLGALNMAEFAYGPTGHNAWHGPARNPWNTAHITGGSSSGSGAAVAARLTYAALGSDTGGSIRLPAHFCGVTGLKVDLWPRQPRQRDAAVLHARHRRPARAKRGRLRADRRDHLRRRSARSGDRWRAGLGQGGGAAAGRAG